jgi:hypothetical protein
MHEQRGFCNKKSKGFLWDSIEIFVTLFDRLAVVSWGNFQFPRKILQLQITMLKQIGGFFHIIKKSPNHKSGNWSQLGKECTYTNIPPNDFEKRAEIIG